MRIHGGLDGCKAGWVAVYRETSTQRVWWQVLPDFAALLGWMPALDGVAIDIPIGLPDTSPRRCDLDARRLIGLRRNSVFPAPIRPVVESRTYPQANAAGRRVHGKGLSKQAWAIVPKIREIDSALRKDVSLQDKVREIHPELCFTVMNAGQPMAHAKRTQAGHQERLRLLEAHFGAKVAEALADRPKGCQPDDLLDAFAALWTAERIGAGTARRLPDLDERDRYALPMAMWA
jgi:predicted RNase H-like nuclease